MKKSNIQLPSMEHLPQQGHSASEAVALDHSHALAASLSNIEVAIAAARQDSAAYRRAFEPTAALSTAMTGDAQRIAPADNVLYQTDREQVVMDDLERRIVQAYADDKPVYHIEHPRQDTEAARMDQNFKDLGYDTNVTA